MLDSWRWLGWRRMIVHGTVDPHSAQMKSNESIAAIPHRYGTRGHAARGTRRRCTDPADG
jgi:hypothetical protein